MDFDQIVKRLEWLDEEHRKDKAAIIDLEERIKAYEGNLDTLSKQFRPLEKQMADLASTASRIEQFEDLNIKQRDQITKTIKDLEKNLDKQDKASVKQHQKEFEGLNKEIDQLKKTASEFSNMKRELKTRASEDSRLQQEIKDLKSSIESVLETVEKSNRSQQLLEETRKQDAKRVSDIQGEQVALRKRVDEARAKTDTTADTTKHLEQRIKELSNNESERKAEQADFIEKQSLAQIDRERSYKEWLGKYDDFQANISKFENQIQALEDTLKNAKRAQDTYNELNTKLERRTSEVTEMQRLAEDRLRQEWVTFKADDQKRWTGYTLSQDEGTKDIRKIVQKMEERVSTIDEAQQTTKDQLHQTASTTEQQLQELMNVAHEWLSAYEQIMGHGKSAKKSKK